VTAAGYRSWSDYQRASVPSPNFRWQFFTLVFRLTEALEKNANGSKILERVAPEPIPSEFIDGPNFENIPSHCCSQHQACPEPGAGPLGYIDLRTSARRVGRFPHLGAPAAFLFFGMNAAVLFDDFADRHIVLLGNSGIRPFTKSNGRCRILVSMLATNDFAIFSGGSMS